MRILKLLFQRLSLESESYRISVALFLRMLSAVYLVAFASLWVQLPGLIGRDGVLPAHFYLRAARAHLGTEAYFLLPTLGWLNSSDLFWQSLCVAGALLALLGLAGRLSWAIFLLLWVFYLSLVTVGRDFLAFQWDALLLEAGFLAIFLARPELLPKRAAGASPTLPVLFLLWWLLFRLMFSSGAVKLLSGDAAWRDFTALNYHYETQPLPNAVSWFMHQLPDRVQKSCVAGMFVSELVLPFLIFAPRRLRRLACAGLVGLQLSIMATGNYAFFNFLTIALCALRVDDTDWEKLGHRAKDRYGLPVHAGGRKWPVWLLLPLTLVMGIVTTAVFTDGLGLRLPWPGPVEQMSRWMAPFCVANRYGLFAVMTTERPEIILEGSQDGEQWQAYEFKYKPGELSRRPPFVAPHQPRLDWQMWFAALGHYQQNPWFGSLCNRLLQGEPAVLALLARNPFPEKPPRFVRGVLYNYRFTDSATKRATGHWWRRELKGLYSPVMSLPGNKGRSREYPPARLASGGQ